MFGSNGPQTEEELGELPDAETRYKEWKETQKKDSPDNQFRYDVIDDGKEDDIYSVIDDPISQEKFRAKKPPLPYWIEMRKGRKAWLKKYMPAIAHGSRYRVYFNTPNGALERVPAWATYVLPDVDGEQSCAVHWEPPPEDIYKWRNKHPKVPKSLRVYECHIGISGTEQKISSFNDFVLNVLPHIKDLGYNAIQLFGLVEHRDYSSVGYKATFYPGLCEPTAQGGLGFNYWVNVSVSEMWLWLLQSVPDQEWSMNKIVSVLTSNNQSSDKMLVYVENHNQSISGARSLAEVVFDKLRKQSFGSTDVAFRGSSILKMIKLITFSICGRAYLNFMGNEFGHPNKVEFPMLSNNHSFSFANRQWNLLMDKGVHSNLFNFDKDMMKLDEDEQILSKGLPKVHHVNESNMIISYLRGPLLFVFNFHPEVLYESYSIGVEEAGEYQVVLNTDEISYGGHGVLKIDQYVQRTSNKRTDGCRNSLEVMLPPRSAQVYKLTRILRV